MVSVTLIEPQTPAEAEFVEALAAAPSVQLRRSPAVPGEPPPEVVLVYLSTLDGDVGAHLRTLRDRFAGSPVLVAVSGTDMSARTAAATLEAVATREPVADRDGATTALARLSPFERHMLRLIADGMTNPEIAGHLGLAGQTVKNYVSAIFTKLGVSRRTEAAVLFTRASLHDAGRGVRSNPPSPAGHDETDDVTLLMRDLRAGIHRMERMISRVTGIKPNRQPGRGPLHGATDVA